MNHIDQMLLDHSNKIQIQTYCDSEDFAVVFSSFPSEKSLKPLLTLVETQRFAWDEVTSLKLSRSLADQMLFFKVRPVNLIPTSDAIDALAKTWKESGYEVAFKHVSYPQQASNETVWQWLNGP